MSLGPPSWTISPSRITAIWSESVSASSWSCVTNSVVISRRSVSILSSTRMSSRSLASRFESGSSSSSAFGWRTSARARARRCCWPPDNCGAGRRSRPIETHQSERLHHAILHLSLGQFALALCERERNIIEHVHVRPDSVGLEHHADGALVRWDVSAP